ncbi:MAG: hypothetical protein LBJ87_07790 [bacterium]|jgi:hypothetical protein|nr:hypothetical protein [bacterium]
MVARSAELRLELGLPLTYRDAVSIPFQLRVEDVERRLGFDNVLSAAWFGDSRTQLILESSYGQPTWLSAPQQMLLHRIVECVTRQFLTGVAAELGDRLCGPPRAPC